MLTNALYGRKGMAAAGSGSRLAAILPVGAVVGAALGSLLLFWRAAPDSPAFFIFCAVLAGALSVALVVGLLAGRRAAAEAPAGGPVDQSLLGTLLISLDQAVAITDRSGRLVAANLLFDECFDELATPPALGLGQQAETRLAEAARVAWRDGTAVISGAQATEVGFAVTIERAGLASDYLVWRFQPTGAEDLIRRAIGLLEGEAGDRFGGAGLMMALLDAEGTLIAANGALIERSGVVPGTAFNDLLFQDEDKVPRFVREGVDGAALRLIAVPLGDDQARHPTLLIIHDERAGIGGDAATHTAPVHIQSLLAMLPLGLSLVDPDGRFLFMNDAFRRAAGIEPDENPVYPGDLVIKEDKAAVSDAIRRFTAGRALAGDVAVRLLHRPDEPVGLTVATARGLNDAAVILSLKDNTEESRLKRQVAQATKMQAVGQLAGGVAHDFNNILTAIIGHCDLMMMRHTPGDSDYDDIQQIKHNSNRAAGLTRQLLAFSRQQTLRPQILQLPDVISEVSNLLKRLLGETVRLEVFHGRNLGPVRADPGQLEQVIVNLAVNARDAMPQGGTLTIRTFAVPAADVRQIDTEIMPAADYSALSVSDTGGGIPPEIMGNIFEPFFTTKEVGKGTGLGLSTVYGIVKQTGGFIFADSELGKGTTFTLYLPVHHLEKTADVQIAAATEKVKAQEMWGTGTVLVVEDDAMVRAVAERALARQGYTVLIATNGEEALSVLSRCEEEDRKVDLLITDVVMPVMDGPSLVREARMRFPNLPILFMSGYAEEQLRHSISIENVAFLPKPFSVQQLGQAARRAMVQSAV